MALNAGEAAVRLSVDSTVAKDLAKAQGQFRAFGSRIVNMQRSMQSKMATGMASLGRLGMGRGGIGGMAAGMGLGMGGMGAGAAIASSLTEFGKLESALARAQMLFRENTTSAVDFSQSLAEGLGRSRRQILDTHSTFQTLFVGLDFGEKHATTFSRAMTDLALNFAAFTNESDDSAVRRFIAALAGSPEVLDQFGIDIKQASLDLKLLEMGLKDTANGASEHAKTLARVAIIYDQMKATGAIDAIIEKNDTWSEGMKRLNAQIEELRISAGSALAGTMKGVVDELTEVVKAVRGLINENPQMITSLLKGAAAITAAGVAMTGFSMAMMAASPLIMAFSGLVATALAAPQVGVPLMMAATAAAVTAGFALMSEQGQSELNDFVGIFENTGLDIVEAMKLGDIELAFDALWVGVVDSAINAMELLGAGIKAGVKDSAKYISPAYGMYDYIDGAWERVSGDIKKDWDSFKRGDIGSVLEGFFDFGGLDPAGDSGGGDSPWQDFLKKHEEMKADVSDRINRGQVTKSRLEGFSQQGVGDVLNSLDAMLKPGKSGGGELANRTAREQKVIAEVIGRAMKEAIPDAMGVVAGQVQMKDGSTLITDRNRITNYREMNTLRNKALAGELGPADMTKSFAGIFGGGGQSPIFKAIEQVRKDAGRLLPKKLTETEKIDLGVPLGDLVSAEKDRQDDPAIAARAKATTSEMISAVKQGRAYSQELVDQRLNLDNLVEQFKAADDPEIGNQIRNVAAKIKELEEALGEPKKLREAMEKREREIMGAALGAEDLDPAKFRKRLGLLGRQATLRDQIADAARRGVDDPMQRAALAGVKKEIGLLDPQFRTDAINKVLGDKTLDATDVDRITDALKELSGIMLEMQNAPAAEMQGLLDRAAEIRAELDGGSSMLTQTLTSGALGRSFAGMDSQEELLDATKVGFKEAQKLRRDMYLEMKRQRGLPVK